VTFIQYGGMSKMYSQISTQKSATFDGIYGKVPTEQVARLREFRLTHPYKQLTIDDTKWEYISCGQGEQTLLLLPGALSVGESTFPLITAFENEYRIIAPSYALSLTMEGLCEGIAHILEAEALNKAHVLGGSFGGLVAQQFVRRYPAKVHSLILSHTFVLTPKYATPIWIAGKLFPALPRSLFVSMLKLRLNKILLSTLRAANHPETEFWCAYLNEAIASDLMRKVFIHQNKCVLDLARKPQFTPDDLNEWNGKILIIGSDDDPGIPARDRALLRSMYPQAQEHTFRDAGHAPFILKREEVISIIRSFLQSMARPAQDTSYTL
jgi:aminoacrylate hydrolase